jgi:hypothetical protein
MTSKRENNERKTKCMKGTRGKNRNYGKNRFKKYENKSK